MKTLALGRQPSCSEVYAAAQASARPALNGLRQAQRQPDERWPDDLAGIADSAQPAFDRLVELLASTQNNLQDNMLSFFTACSRRNLDSGLLGGQGKRRDNYYTLGTKLLETLVQLLVLKPSDPPKSRPLDVYDFVEQLKERYGIWIDKPPPALDLDYESRQAAQANFVALKEKLRQLGFFRAVTDARRMQRLKPRYIPAGDRANT